MKNFNFLFYIENFVELSMWQFRIFANFDEMVLNFKLEVAFFGYTQFAISIFRILSQYVFTRNYDKHLYFYFKNQHMYSNLKRFLT